jgi:uncharacterized protein YggE
VVSISETAASLPGPYYAGAAIRDAAALTPVERGSQEVQATVTVIFELD